jgi:hypothetical protein
MAVTSSSAARADEAQAKTLFKAMSDYLAAQNAISSAIFLMSGSKFVISNSMMAFAVALH